MPDLTFMKAQGQAIEAVRDQLAALRMTVFRNFPYLYQGDIAYERAYLETYIRSERSLLFAVRDGDQLVGATTALPLLDETAEVQAPFRRAGYDLSRIVYFGESILLPAYRGSGLGNRFFDEREAHARQFGTYTTACFCAVQRPADHPLRPKDYKPLDAFWIKRGYTCRPDLNTTFDWPDRGETESTPKAMTYWTRPL
ncbi:GNAT family N-acetyltransferase [Spirosoma utsteinense]|uniref:GNAT superfamily N-acetyltransferase n=1 Tax=Spirosoma utsteinense TaxID=2585773 RepID=A0ABR6W0K0_9BACT|nr:GNAT family N-acetyltransferase [Spirosoma utsteinense]MBC3783718.1 GNAT superfamily N-acetyltransferase [Spirosoma utsteinense]MBC3790139.1 GNAT superfamily N-acetyltransferase [Spirosoma utsteinense]